MTIDEIKQLLEESGENGILFELPYFSSHERLYLNKFGDFYHLSNFGQSIEPTELMPDEIDSDNWMPRDWNEPVKVVIKTPKDVQNFIQDENPISELDELLDYLSTWEPTPEFIQQVSDLITNMEEQFEREAISRRVTTESLNMKYDL